MRFSRFHRLSGRARRVRNSSTSSSVDSRINSSQMYSGKGLDGQNVLLVGPGWLGGAAAIALTDAGARVWTVQRGPGGAGALFAPAPDADSPPQPGRTLPSEERGARDGIVRLAGDIRMPVGWTDALPSTVHHIVVCVAPSRGAGDNHATTYPAALQGALRLAEQHGTRSLVYTSSTGVYGRSDGGASHEDDAIEAVDERQGALLHAEKLLETAAASVSRTILRVAGLYGPSRDPASRFTREIPSGADDVWCNFAWRDDVVAAIVRCVEHPAAPFATRVYNCADGTPVRASRIAAALGAPHTRSPSGESAGAATAPQSRPVGRSNQRIYSERLRETGWEPRMTTVFDGLVALGHRVDPVAEAALARIDLELQ